MKRFATFWLLGFAVSLYPFFNTSAAGKIVRLTSGEWLPFQSESALKHHGVISRIVTEAFATQGVEVEYGFFPWARSIRYAKTGVWDGSLAWAMGRRDFTEDFYFSDPILTVPKALFYLKKKPLKWEKMEDLAGLTIGTTASYTYGEEFDQAKKDGVFNVQEVSNDLQNIRKLLHGRLDAFAMEIDVAYYLMYKDFEPGEINKITYSPKLLMNAEMCVIFPKKSQKSETWIKILNQGLEQLKRDGIIDRYIQESRIGRYINSSENIRRRP